MPTQSVYPRPLPKVPSNPDEIISWADGITRILSGIIADLGQLGIKSYTTATLPGASTRNKNTIVYVSDGAAGSKFQGSTGSAWLGLG